MVILAGNDTILCIILILEQSSLHKSASMSEYKKLQNQPLKIVLAEFRFSPVVQMGDYVPQIQEALRKQYPVFEQSSEQTIQVQSNNVSVSTGHWSFISADRKSAVSLNQERLIYTTTDYPRFPKFRGHCQQIVDLLAEVVNPSLILRVGLRYSDLIEPENGQGIATLVDGHFGYPECYNSIGVAQRQHTEATLRTKEGILVIRSFYGEHDLPCPPDMLNLPVAIRRDTESSERLILDFDHIWEAGDEPVELEPVKVLDKLDSLHETSREAFWKITTEHARNNVWQ